MFTNSPRYCMVLTEGSKNTTIFDMLHLQKGMVTPFLPFWLWGNQENVLKALHTLEDWVWTNNLNMKLILIMKVQRYNSFMLSWPVNLNKTLLLPFWVKNEPTNILFSRLNLRSQNGRSTIMYTMQISERKKELHQTRKSEKMKVHSYLVLDECIQEEKKAISFQFIYRLHGEKQDIN